MYSLTVLEVRCPKIKFSRAVFLLEALRENLFPSLFQLLETAGIAGEGAFLYLQPGSAASSHLSLALSLTFASIVTSPPLTVTQLSP